MNPLSQNECRALLSAVEAIHGITGIEQFPSGVFSALRKVFSCNSICYNEIALPDIMKSWIMEPAEAFPGPPLKESFLRHYNEHPVFFHYTRSGDLNSYRISDFLSQRQFHDLVLYNEYYRQSSVEYQLATCFLLNPDWMIGVTLDRHCRDFSESDRLSLDLLRPHLVQAYRNIQTLDLMKRVIEGTGSRLLTVNRSGDVEMASDDVWRTIARFFNVSYFQKTLPDMLKSWIVYERARFSDESDVPSPSIPLVINNLHRKLTIHLMWGGKTAGQDMLLLEEEPGGHNAGIPDEFGLTRRETEILAWIAQGRTNAEIGLGLSISPRTVKKHLENIYSKLQVHGRGTAVARFYRL
jgi:DNA-binding CsgD family transcriptional regulator